MRIYTRTGDHGETGLLGGVRVSKNHLAIRTCGELDETNSHLGLARSQGLPNNVERIIAEIQQDLFVVGNQVAASESGQTKRAAMLSENRVTELEQQIDAFEVHLAPIDAFILPGGCVSGAQLHVARTVCRRAERSIVEMSQLAATSELANCIIYLNRLSDLLFVMARYVNHVNKTPETKWLPR